MAHKAELACQCYDFMSEYSLNGKSQFLFSLALIVEVFQILVEFIIKIILIVTLSIINYFEVCTTLFLPLVRDCIEQRLATMLITYYNVWNMLEDSAFGNPFNGNKRILSLNTKRNPINKKHRKKERMGHI